MGGAPAAPWPGRIAGWHPAPVDAHLTRSGRDLSVGTRICLLVAGLLVVAAGYLLVSPLERASASGPPFDCGTALAPAAGDFARSVCGDLNQRRQLQGGAVLLAALALGAGGRVAFGPLRQRSGAAPAAPAAGPGSGPEWVRPPARSAYPPAALPAARRTAEEDEEPADAGPRDPDRG
jgi:hypothetical protein